MDEVQVGTCGCMHVLWILLVAEAAQVPSMPVKPFYHIAAMLRQVLFRTSARRNPKSRISSCLIYVCVTGVFFGD